MKAKKSKVFKSGNRIQMISLLLLLMVFFGHYGIDCNATQMRNAEMVDHFGSKYQGVYRCNRLAEKMIALTFDDGPHPKQTEEILRILKKYDIKATFFLVGQNAEYYPETAKHIRQAGHEIGNHTFSHARISKISAASMREELLHCQKAVGIGQNGEALLFRPPEGAVDARLRELCQNLGYKIVLWSVDTRDWSHVPSEQIVSKVLENIRDGDIILMHDYIGKSSPTAEALEKIIPALLSRGYQFVPVSELLDMGTGVFEPE